jgi:hypothetical protein
MLSIASLGIYSGLPPYWALASRGFQGTAAAAAIALINSIGNVGPSPRSQSSAVAIAANSAAACGVYTSCIAARMASA